MDNKFFDTSMTAEERLDWLLSEMTMDEKLSCMASTEPAVERLGIGSFSVGGEAAHGVEARNDQNEIGTPEDTTSFPEPIGMSASWDTEMIKKAGAVTGTEARVIYHRHPDRGLSRWAPTVDLERDPRWGRTEEGYGEDPFLTGAMASAYIQGMQGDDPEHLRIAATLKHFYGNNTEDGRTWKSSSIDPRNKYELYFEPFRRAVQYGHAEAMMTAYNRINGTPGMLNREVREIFKKKFGLKHAVCDGGAMELVQSSHHYFGMHAETFAAALKAGIDAMSDRPELVEQAAREAYEHHLIDEKDIDEALRNIFRTKLKLGIYDNDGSDPYDQVTEADIDSEYNRAICMQLSREAVVLLKNNSMLPLSTDAAEGSVALVGPLADSWYQDWYGGHAPYRKTLKDGIQEILGRDIKADDGWDRVVFSINDKGIAAADDGRLYLSDKPDTFAVNDWGDGNFTFFCERTGRYMNSRTGNEDVHKRAGNPIAADKRDTCDWFVMELFHMHKCSNGNVTLGDRFDMPVTADEDGYIMAAKGRSPAEFRMTVQENGIEKACIDAKGRDVVILALGCNPMINAKEEVDRRTIALPPYQQELMDKVYEVNKNIILVLFSDYPYSINQAQKKLPAIIHSASGSQDMGTAMVEAIFGRFSPAGRLNMTWYTGDDQLPDIDDYDIIKGKRTYRYFDGEVLYPFGHGLTYAAFDYLSLSCSVKDKAELYIVCTIKNTGNRVSDEVVQIYAKAPQSRVRKPLKQLIAFRRVKDIVPGETRTLEFTVPVEEVRFYDVVSRRLMVEAGKYKIYAGASSADIRLSSEVYVPGEKTGFRDMTKEIPAELYDDYENIRLWEGHLGYTAAVADSDDKTAKLIYRDCCFPSCEGILSLHMKSDCGCSIEITLNGKKAGFWQGDTRTWSSHNGLIMEKDSGSFRQEHRCEGAMYMDIPVRLNAADTAGSVSMEINITGEASICWLRFDRDKQTGGQR